MRQFLVIFAFVAVVTSAPGVDKKFDQDKDWADAKSIYEFTVNDIDGNPVPLKKYEGYALIVVNVASHCGLTAGNYEQLQALYEKYGKDRLRILGFPSNEFNNQEPGTNTEIKNLVKSTYGVTFDLFEKIKVNGEDAHPLFKWLKSRSLNGAKNDDAIEWNFVKFLVDKEGNVGDRIPSKVYPNEFEDKLKSYLKQ